MRKILSILLVFVMLFSTAFAAAPSPTTAMLIHSNPACEYVLADQLENWDEIVANTFENEDFMNILKEHYFNPDYSYFLDEFLMIEVLPYNDYVVWHFAEQYEREARIYAVLVNMDYEIYSVLVGDPLLDGTVLFDFNPIEGGTYYMLVFSDI